VQTIFAVSAMKTALASSGSDLHEKVSFLPALLLYLLEGTIVRHLPQHSIVTGSAYKALCSTYRPERRGLTKDSKSHRHNLFHRSW
jgi:hypothetical protein